MLDGGGIIELHVIGKAFQKGNASLSSVVNILSGYKQSFQFCINQASIRCSIKGEPPIKTRLSLRAIKSGTLTAETFIDTLPALVPMLPQIIDYGWQTYQKAQELIKVATMFFNNHERPVPMHIENSPGAIALNIQAQGNVTITPDVFFAAAAIHKPLNSIAKEVSSRSADSVTIAPERENAVIDINRDNCKLFDLPYRNTVDEESIEIECALYSLNKHSYNGRLEFMEDNKVRVIPFKIEDGNVSDYIAALGADKSTVTATREMKINALGEKTITKLHLLGIDNTKDPA